MGGPRAAVFRDSHEATLLISVHNVRLVDVRDLDLDELRLQELHIVRATIHGIPRSETKAGSPYRKGADGFLRIPEC